MASRRRAVHQKTTSRRLDAIETRLEHRDNSKSATGRVKVVITDVKTNYPTGDRKYVFCRVQQPGGDDTTEGADGELTATGETLYALATGTVPGPGLTGLVDLIEGKWVFRS